MRLLKTFIRNNTGFTLIEVLIVLGIFSVLGGIGVFASLDTYRGYAFRSERDTLVSLLAKARSESMSNICLGAGCVGGKTHGVLVTADEYILFQGISSTMRNQDVDERVPIVYRGLMVASSSLVEVVFSQLSGDVAATGTITLIDAVGHNSVIGISQEGRISWTN